MQAPGSRADILAATLGRRRHQHTSAPPGACLTAPPPAALSHKNLHEFTAAHRARARCRPAAGLRARAAGCARRRHARAAGLAQAREEPRGGAQIARAQGAAHRGAAAQRGRSAGRERAAAAVRAGDQRQGVRRAGRAAPAAGARPGAPRPSACRRLASWPPACRPSIACCGCGAGRPRLGRRRSATSGLLPAMPPCLQCIAVQVGRALALPLQAMPPNGTLHQKSSAIPCEPPGT